MCIVVFETAEQMRKYSKRKVLPAERDQRSTFQLVQRNDTVVIGCPMHEPSVAFLALLPQTVSKLLPVHM